MIVFFRRVLDDVVGAESVGHLVLAHLHGHGLHPRHGLHIGRVEFVQLRNPVQNAGKLRLEPLRLLIGDGDAGETSDTKDCGAIDRHGFGRGP